MYRFNSFRPVAIAVAAFVGLACAGTASAQVPVPFQGSGIVTVTGATLVPPSTQILTGSATGEATHLGKFTRTETVTLDLNTFKFTAKKMVFTAANGDQLWADAAGAFSTPALASGTYTFIGGTGRFQNATGTAVFTATGVPGGFAVSFVGTIRY